MIFFFLWFKSCWVFKFFVIEGSCLSLILKRLLFDVMVECIELVVEISEKYICMQRALIVCSASSARLRLLRLSEAAEKLKRQAAINVHRGKESDARELLFQKKKVMQAMEKSKNRIELLDELCTKLNEVREELFQILFLTNACVLTEDLGPMLTKLLLVIRSIAAVILRTF